MPARRRGARFFRQGFRAENNVRDQARAGEERGEFVAPVLDRWVFETSGVVVGRGERRGVSGVLLSWMRITNNGTRLDGKARGAMFVTWEPATTSWKEELFDTPFSLRNRQRRELPTVTL